MKTAREKAESEVVRCALRVHRMDEDHSDMYEAMLDLSRVTRALDELIAEEERAWRAVGL